MKLGCCAANFNAFLPGGRSRDSQSDRLTEPLSTRVFTLNSRSRSKWASRFLRNRHIEVIRTSSSFLLLVIALTSSFVTRYDQAVQKTEQLNSKAREKLREVPVILDSGCWESFNPGLWRCGMNFDL